MPELISALPGFLGSKRHRKEYMDNIFERAVIFAARAHQGVNRKGNSLPYLIHPLEAAVIVSGITQDRELMAAAILHDTVEDCEGITLKIIEENFGKRIAELVGAESENKSDSWEKRKGNTLKYLKEADKEVKIVALGDKLSNMRAISRDYETVGEKLWERFHVKEKAKHGWYYSGLVDSLKELDDFEAYQEFKELVKKVFGTNDNLFCKDFSDRGEIR